MIASTPDLRALVGRGLAVRPDGVPISIDFASIGLHLGSVFLRYKGTADRLPLPSEARTEIIRLNDNGVLDFPPRATVLAASLEQINMPLDHMGFVQTKGTIARGFVIAHLCDGQVDPGFRGQITLELVNLSSFHYTIRPGLPIAQLFLHRLSSALSSGYDGRYQSAQGPTSMRVSSDTPRRKSTKPKR